MYLNTYKKLLFITDYTILFSNVPKPLNKWCINTISHIFAARYKKLYAHGPADATDTASSCA